MREFCAACEEDHPMGPACVKKAREKRMKEEKEKESNVGEKTISKKLNEKKEEDNVPKRLYRHKAPEFRRPKGKTYRAAHYGPRNYDAQKVQEIIKKKKINDSKPGGRSWTQGKLKSKKVLGSERLNPPNMARVWSFNWNEETPDQDWNQMWGV